MDEDPDDTYWERMPPEYREEFLARREAARRLEGELEQDQLRFAWKYAIAGAALGSIWSLLQGEMGPGFRILLLLACGATGFLIAQRRLDMFTGVVAYGLPGVAICVLAGLSGPVRGSVFGLLFMFCSWLMFLVTGGMLAFVSELEYDRRWRTS